MWGGVSVVVWVRGVHFERAVDTGLTSYVSHKADCVAALGLIPSPPCLLFRAGGGGSTAG